MHHHDIRYVTTDNDIILPHFGTPKFQYKKFYELSSLVIVMYDLLSNFVEYKRIRAIFAILSTVEFSYINTVKSHLLKLFNSEKLKLQNLLDSVQGRIYLTLNL